MGGVDGVLGDVAVATSGVVVDVTMIRLLTCDVVRDVLGD